MKIIKNKLVNKRQFYKIQKNGRIFEGRLWIRKLWKHEGGYSVFVFIGKECLGRLYINKLGILFNLKKISGYNKTWCTESTIKKHFRESIIEYFNTFEIIPQKPKIITKIIKPEYIQSYFNKLKNQAISLIGVN